MFNVQLSSIAEEEGFEPPVRFPVQRFSRPPVSTAHPFLRFREYYLGCGECQVLDREVLFAIRFLRAESYRSRYGIGMFDGHRTEIGSSFNGNEVAARRFHVELISVAERDFQRKRFGSPVGTELDLGYGSHRYLAVNAALAIRQQCVHAPAFNDPAKLRVSDGYFHTVLESNDDRLAGRRGHSRLRPPWWWRLRRLSSLERQNPDQGQNPQH